MYFIVESEDMIRIPPPLLGEDYDKVVRELAYEKLEGRAGSLPDNPKDKYVILVVLEVEPVGDGVIVHGDGAVYQKVRYKALAYQPMLQEVVEGMVVDVLRFGAFIRFGPMDGLLHISQIMDDRIDVDEVNKRLVGKETKKSIKVGDKLRVRIVAVSLSDVNVRDSKIGLTMRQPGLGKLEWLEEERKKEESK